MNTNSNYSNSVSDLFLRYAVRTPRIRYSDGYGIRTLNNNDNASLSTGSIHVVPQQNFYPIPTTSTSSNNFQQRNLEIRQQNSVDHLPTEIEKMDESFDLEELLQCPICFEICTPPIFQCVAGHTICYTCKTKVLKKCPSCKRPISDDSRNRTLETIYSSVKFKCVNFVAGCKETPTGETFEQHIKSCTYKPFICKFFNDKLQCNLKTVKISSSTLGKHFEHDHEVKMFKTGNYCSHSIRLLQAVDIPLACWEFDGQLFLESIAIINSKVCYTIFLIGDASKAAKYSIDVQVIRVGIQCAPGIRKAFFPLDARSIWEMNPSTLLVRPSPSQFSFTFDEATFKNNVARLEEGTTSCYSWTTRLDFKVKKTPSSSVS